MRAALQLATLGIAVAALGGCDRPASDPPLPQAPAATAPTAGTSVPAADSVLGPEVVGKPDADPATGRSNAGLTKAQESEAMPLPGQNNDHSAPLAAAPGASRP